MANIIQAFPNGKGESSGSSGHTIQNESGTNMTARENLQFVGANVTDNSSGNKTVVTVPEPKKMASADMTEILSPLPGIRSKYHKYSTTEQIVGEWIDGKPIYEKIIQDTIPTTSTIGTEASKYVSIGASVNKIINIVSMFSNTNGVFFPIYQVDGARTSHIRQIARGNSATSYPNTVQLINSNTAWNGTPIYITLQYTKTTD